MSKVDAQRAMREEKYARDSAAALSRRTAAAGGAKPPAATPAPSARATPAAGADTKDTDGKTDARTDAAPRGAARCGHKSMNGRECTREAGHAEKSHRYS